MSLTEAQSSAIAARGNVIVVAGAGTGKTRTLTERCLSLVQAGCSLEQMLLVTFTDAAAAEMRHRIRHAFHASEDGTPHLIEQAALVETANICTLHSFCLQLVRQHFYELNLDPQFAVLDERQTTPLAIETLDTLFQRIYADTSPQSDAVRELIRKRGRGGDEPIRRQIIQLHRFTQTLPHPDAWIERQLTECAMAEPLTWQACLYDAVQLWRDTWLPLLQRSATDCQNLAECCAAVAHLPAKFGIVELAQALEAINAADAAAWPRGCKSRLRKPFERFFSEAEFLRSVCSSEPGRNPLAEDWEWSRHDIAALLILTRQFTSEFTHAKQERGGVDFSDLEQLAHRLLVDPGTRRPTSIARQWQQQFEFLFIDEYQDINSVQDAILSALSRSGPDANRFLVGDAKQSIYRFRLANPRIFCGYESVWAEPAGEGCKIVLRDNFRSREALLRFINSFFAPLMRSRIGGLDYSEDVHLQFGNPAGREALRDNGPRVQWHFIIANGNRKTALEPAAGTESIAEQAANVDSDFTDGQSELLDLLAAEKEARLVAQQLKRLKDEAHSIWDEKAKSFRPVRWQDMVVLMRSPAHNVDAFAKEFHRCGVPLLASRGGFFHSIEVSDILSLLQILDNPLQDLPLLAVLRSPLVGLTLDELVQIRVCSRQTLFWTALKRFHQIGTVSANGHSEPDDPNDQSLWHKLDRFLAGYSRWRELIRLASLSACLERVLADTGYDSLLLAERRGAERAANVKRLLDLVRQFDPFQRQGLFRFLNFVRAQRLAELDEEPAPIATEDAVRLVSIHKSKGLEFPVVVVADLGKQFNFRSLYEDLILDEQYGLCPQVIPPENDRRYPSLPYWLAQRRERAELMGEEMRLLYVALTRARDTLLLTGMTDGKAISGTDNLNTAIDDRDILAARSYAAWFKLWSAFSMPELDCSPGTAGRSDLIEWTFYSEDDPILAVSEDHKAAPSVDQEIAHHDGSVTALKERLRWRYPYPQATTEPAKTTVSILRRRLDPELNDEARPARFVSLHRSAETADSDKGNLSAAETGIAHHRFLELMSLDQPHHLAALESEAQQLTSRGLISPEQVQALDLASVAEFWTSDIGRTIAGEHASIRRELPFTARFSLEELANLGMQQKPPGEQLGSEVQNDAISNPSMQERLFNPPPESRAPESIPATADTSDGVADFVVVQGVVDLAVILPDEIWLLDFKTDRVEGRKLDERAASYRAQLHLYACALERIYCRPVTRRWLHFLKARRTLSFQAPPTDRVPSAG